MKRSVYIAALSIMVVLVFAAIASAQESTDQSSSDPNSSTSTDQTQSPTSQQEAAPSEQATSAQNAPTVRISANGFDPAQVDVPPGTPLNFVNEDTVPHTVVLKGLFSTAEIPAGYSYPVTLNGAGTVTYHDKANSQMEGTINVGGASQGEATSPEGSATEPSQTASDTTQTANDSQQTSGDSGQTDSSP